MSLSWCSTKDTSLQKFKTSIGQKERGLESVSLIWSKVLNFHQSLDSSRIRMVDQVANACIPGRRQGCVNYCALCSGFRHTCKNGNTCYHEASLPSILRSTVSVSPSAYRAGRSRRSGCRAGPKSELVKLLHCSRNSFDRASLK